jgi:integrase/recombinase XerD
MGEAAAMSSTVTPLERLARDFLANCRARNLSAKTINQVYGPRLENLFLPWCRAEGITEVGEIDQRVLDRFSGGLLERGGERKAKLSPVTVASYARSINSFLAWAKTEKENVKGKVAMPKLPERHIPVLSRDEIDRMEKAAGNERDKVIVRTLADTAIRVEELVGLTTEDIKDEDRRDYLLIHGKAGARVSTRDRLVPIPPALARRLRRHARSRPHDARTNKLFLGLRRDMRSGEYLPLTASGVEQMIRYVALEANIGRRVYPHLFRHSYATYMLQRDKDGRRRMDSTELRKILGHKSTVMIDRTYAHLLDSDIADSAIRALS